MALLSTLLTDPTLPLIRTRNIITQKIISYLQQEMIMEKLLSTVIHLLSKTRSIFKVKAIQVMLLPSDGQKTIQELFLLEDKINVLWFGKFRKKVVHNKTLKVIKVQKKSKSDSSYFSHI